ncbi:BREX-1 system adenine-specific DNA-methyltransferase PglX [Pseudomonas lurida]|uniref:BREX-1 system adenine-specific DNA-methyltransferase PglX n=1 Tax=Pseudomonas lurida TaxID=244566 RepID=UPI002734A4CE|nr:BREX-1 system adenine-specific DNA-methyltransferase PglX [Pseudomonas lurida]WLG27803.1 BREX-1 system adenine-specific DNA-methyltransferase PglX [Pseudomonas lurida]
MNTGNIKRYAPKARRAFIAAMTKRAALFGIRESSIPSMGIESLEQKGDLALIGDRPFPASIIRPRAALVQKVEQMGFAQAMEQSAYSWFNRLCAIRYMELKGYLEHGRRVLSHPDQSGSFQILDDCMDIELEGMDRQRIAELKLDGTKDEELYRELLLAQCHALYKAMPFLFEAVDDATELLLPDNLTKTDSLIRELVSAIPEDDWQNVEIIGWLYQFYLSEKKDQVIGKVVKSEDIPAATQLFTPNWIVQYLVQNSVGRKWLQTYPNSQLKEKMPYYIEPAEQALEVRAELARITPESIDPLSIKVLDPACGSGHILVEAYKVLKSIYEERGHRVRDIPQLILEHNLFGLDIDDRAGQLAGFTLMMLAREDDRRIFGRQIKLNVLALQESLHIDLATLWKGLNLSNDWQHGQSQSLFSSEQMELGTAEVDSRYQLLKNTLIRFTQAKTFGSLIEVPNGDAEPLGELLGVLYHLTQSGDVMQKTAALQLIPYIQQALILAQRFDVVVANPPYMGGKGMNSYLKEFAGKAYSNSKSDLFSIFIERGFGWLKPSGLNSMVTMQSWMFLSSYEKMRDVILTKKNIQNLMQIGYNSFPELNSKVVQCVAFTIENRQVDGFKGSYINLNSDKQSEKKDELFRRSKGSLTFELEQSSFSKIPGAPIAYWISDTIRDSFVKFDSVSDIGDTRQGLATSDNDRFLRYWYEVDNLKTCSDANDREDAKSKLKKWFPLIKGGIFRKWYGNLEYVINWEDDGRELLSYAASLYGSPTRTIKSIPMYFKENIGWSRISSGKLSLRYYPAGCIFSDAGSCIFFNEKNDLLDTIAVLNSKQVHGFTEILSPTLTFEAGQVSRIPIPRAELSREVPEIAGELVRIGKKDWDSFEVSMEYSRSPLIIQINGSTCLKESYEETIKAQAEMIRLMHDKELMLNLKIASSYGMELPADFNIPIEEITIDVNPAYRFRGTGNDPALVYRSSTISELISYVIGCVMGRYSLDREGLVYAHTGNKGFAELVAKSTYKTFPADSDGILPQTDQEWFGDDATNRFREFVRTVWGDKHLQENLDFVAESLCLHAIKPKRGESAVDTIRRYLSTQFFKDHLKTYKKRPIYWLFSSGKHKAFECLVYLHRYNEGTLARMRTEYVIPLTAKLNTYANKLTTDIENETVTSEKKRLEKELAALHNQQAELATFDENLRHYADQRISLDLDEGVKVNYGKFGGLLAEVKAITGSATE